MKSSAVNDKEGGNLLGGDVPSDELNLPGSRESYDESTTCKGAFLALKQMVHRHSSLINLRGLQVTI